MAKQSTIRKPTKVERARDQLESAVDRLERVLASRPAPGAQSQTDEDVAALREENAELRQLNARVSDRLDDAIGRLRQVLAE